MSGRPEAAALLKQEYGGPWFLFCSKGLPQLPRGTDLIQSPSCFTDRKLRHCVGVWTLDTQLKPSVSQGCGKMDLPHRII